MIKHRLLLFSFILGLIESPPTAVAQLVPQPHRLQIAELQVAELQVADSDQPDDTGNVIRCEEARFQPQVDVLITALQKIGADRISGADRSGKAATVVFRRATSIADDGYHVTTRDGHLLVEASSTQGAARAAATLIQTVRISDGNATWPSLQIEDKPSFSYRSFMIDMGRNPHSPKTVRRVVDMMWFYKANYLHLHLMDDQLFSWPSKAFPRLYSERAGWTWEDFQKLHDYAKARGVAIVPEIEVPGHSTILRREYPEVFGANPTELATSSTAQAAIETLIDEVLQVFPTSPFMHIGGDEAYGVPQDIQRDLINRLNKHITSKGKRTLVWEGPGLGQGKHKVSEDVIHINWRTIDFPAQQMLDAGYEVVSAPWDPMYIVDHYPRTMFTAVDLERCYRWDPQSFAHINHGFPTFSEPHRTDTTKGILGFCMPWWEGRQENLFSLCLPRFAAVASAAWNREGESDFADFEVRQARAIPLLQQISGIELPPMPYADPDTQTSNLAYRGMVIPSAGATQPHFGPNRLTNGITERFDHFLGFPTQPDPLEIVIQLPSPATIARIVIYETAVGESHELYELLVSTDGTSFSSVGITDRDSRGDSNHVEHRFDPRRVSQIKIRTQGCHGLTFPSFSRLTEVMAFAD